MTGWRRHQPVDTGARPAAWLPRRHGPSSEPAAAPAAAPRVRAAARDRLRVGSRVAAMIASAASRWGLFVGCRGQDRSLACSPVRWAGDGGGCATLCGRPAPPHIGVIGEPSRGRVLPEKDRVKLLLQRRRGWLGSGTVDVEQRERCHVSEDPARIAAHVRRPKEAVRRRIGPRPDGGSRRSRIGDVQ